MGQQNASRVNKKVPNSANTHSGSLESLSLSSGGYINPDVGFQPPFHPILRIENCVAHQPGSHKYIKSKANRKKNNAENSLLQAFPNINAATFNLEFMSLVFHGDTLENLEGTLLLPKNPLNSKEGNRFWDQLTRLRVHAGKGKSYPKGTWNTEARWVGSLYNKKLIGQV